MKNKSIIVLFFAFMSAVMAGCLSTAVSEQDQKAAENDLQIQDYIKVKGLTATKATSGMYYYFVKTNPAGVSPQSADLVTIHYSVQNFSGVSLDSTSRTKNQPYTYSFGYGAALFYQGLALMKKGERLVMLLPSQLAFGGQAYTNLPAYSPVRVEIELLDTRSEDKAIDDYITANKFVVTEKTSSGVRVIKTRLNPSGTQATSGLGITLNYAGRLLYKNNMTKNNVFVYDDLFDSGNDLNFQVGFKTVVDGFDEGSSKFRKGEAGIIIFPSSLGYKTTAQNNIPAGSPLRFDIDVTNVK